MKNIAKRLTDINKKLDACLEEFKKADLMDDVTEELTETVGGDQINMALADKITGLQEKVERLELQK